MFGGTHSTFIFILISQKIKLVLHSRLINKILLVNKLQDVISLLNINFLFPPENLNNLWSS